MSVGGLVAALGTAGVASAAGNGAASDAPAPAAQDTAAPPVDVGNEPPENAPLPPCPVEPQAPPPVAAAPPPAPPRQHHDNRIFAPQRIAVSAGAGAGNYFGGQTASDTGATWDARLTFGAHSVFALEAGYVGSLNSLDAPTTNGASVVSHGFDGDLRLQLPARVQPYVFGGVGYNHMAVDTTSRSGAQLSQSDDQLTVPAGGGLAAYVGGHVMLDLRGTYRFIPDNENTVMSPNRNLHQWVAQAHIGYAF